MQVMVVRTWLVHQIASMHTLRVGGTATWRFLCAVYPESVLRRTLSHHV